ncbi:MAG: hydroxysqualene dehydroxylase HpnE [Planctomycetota bacterium]
MSQDQAKRLPASALVMGGGVAGVAAALRLADAGVRVILVEMRPRLGGRATSMPDPATGELLDNCQHVVMRCCTAITELYEQLGVADRIEWHRRFYFVHGDGTRAELAASGLPVPLHFAPAFMRFRGLTWGDKWAIARAMRAIRAVPLARRNALNAISFAEWLKQQRQPARAVERFWEVTVVSACNQTLDRCAAGYALQVFQEGFLASRSGYEMGLSRVPLAELYGPAERRIAAAGGGIETAGVKGLDYDAGRRRVTAVRLNDGRRLEAAAYVSALPFEALDRMAGPAMKADDPRLQRLGELNTSPIVGLHLWVRSPKHTVTTTLPHVVLTGSPIQWFFNRGWEDGRDAQHLHGVVSAAHDLLDKPNAEILDLAVGELRRFVPGGGDAELIEGRVVKERRATFSCEPGVDALRPPVAGAIGNLWLAGDWTATGWPATMEGAARSGFAAADEMMSAANDGTPG